MAPESAPVALFSGLLDDAALFPPGNAPMVRAVSEHRAHHRSGHAALVGPFVCPDSRLAELVAEVTRHPSSAELAVSIVVGGGPSSVGQVVSEVDREHSLRLVALEVPLGVGTGAPARAVTTAEAFAESAHSIAGYVEVPRGLEREAVLDVLAEHRLPAKLRTGGPSAEAFPPDVEVAGFLLACAARDLAFKCTAGLHAGVRHDVPGPAGGEVVQQQGFLNILLATSASVDGAGIGEIAAVLGERDETMVRKAVAALGPEQVIRARRRFRSFGTCSVPEPIDDLIRLGLLESRLIPA